MLLASFLYHFCIIFASFIIQNKTILSIFIAFDKNSIVLLIMKHKKILPYQKSPLHKYSSCNEDLIIILCLFYTQPFCKTYLVSSCTSHITWKVFHFPDFCLHRKITARIVQSQTIAIAIPITPISSVIPKRYDKSNRPKIVDAIETYIVNFTSPAARSPLLSAPEKGNITALNTLWISTSQITRFFVSGDKE